VNEWKRFKANEIPGTMDLFPIFFDIFKPDWRILDLGCGPGRICERLINAGFHSIHGMDINADGLRLARTRSRAVLYAAGDASAAPYADASFDGVYMQAVLTTITDPDARRRTMEEIARILRRPGRLYMAVFGMTPEQPIYQARYQKGVEQGHPEGTFEVIDPESGQLLYLARHFTKPELVALLNEAGFGIMYYQAKEFTTRTGNRINGHVVVAGID
jgi:ubiquinone/menaquinone biosynthesis C-methylase UbiE